MLELWKPVVSFETFYEVSSFGNVRRISTKRVLKLTPMNGYVSVNLYPGSRKNKKQAYVHRLVVEAFISPVIPGHSLEVNHKDGCKTNNIIENLEYVTPKRNHCHAVKLKLKASFVKENNPKCKLTLNQVMEIRHKYSQLKRTQVELAKEYNVTRQTIWGIVHSKTWV